MEDEKIDSTDTIEDSDEGLDATSLLSDNDEALTLDDLGDSDEEAEKPDEDEKDDDDSEKSVGDKEVDEEEDDQEDDGDDDEDEEEKEEGSDDEEEVDDFLKESEEETTLPEDPGDFEPGDYSFEVTLNDGKTHKIENPDDLDKLGDDPQFKSAKDLVQFNANYSKMVQGIEQDRKEYEEAKKEFDEQKDTQTERAEQLQQWENEIDYLTKEGKLPEVDKKFQEEDWTDPKVAKQPGVKERLELVKFMAKENKKRIEAGLEPIKSMLDAYNNKRLEDAETKQAKANKKEVTKRKKKGAMVGGTSSTTTSNVPDDVIVGEGGSLTDITNSLL